MAIFTLVIVTPTAALISKEHLGQVTATVAEMLLLESDAYLLNYW